MKSQNSAEFYGAIMNIEQACAFFAKHGIDVSVANRDVLAAAYKALAKKLHPDASGSNASMAALNQAYDVVIEHLRTKEDAPHNYSTYGARKGREKQRNAHGEYNTSDKADIPNRNSKSKAGNDFSSNVILGVIIRFVRSTIYLAALVLVIVFARVAGSGLAGLHLGTKSPVVSNSSHWSSSEVNSAKDIFKNGVHPSAYGKRSWCRPIHGNVKIYSDSSLSSRHSEWLENNYLGSSWFIEVETEGNLGGTSYIYGALYSPSGDVNNYNIYGLSSDFECKSSKEDLSHDLEKLALESPQSFSKTCSNVVYMSKVYTDNGLTKPHPYLTGLSNNPAWYISVNSEGNSASSGYYSGELTSPMGQRVNATVDLYFDKKEWKCWHTQLRR